MTTRLPLSVAALRLRLTYQQVRTLILRGELQGGRDEFGHFYADEDHVERFAVQRAKHAERTSVAR
jgi:hypothetical protein